jgi:uncharacterized protein YkwD
MASQNFFSHEGDGNPASRAAGAGYMAGARAWGVGEDLEWGEGRMGTPKAIVRGWMRSPEHRSVLLSRRFRQVGVGATLGSPVSPDVQNAVVYTAPPSSDSGRDKWVELSPSGVGPPTWLQGRCG